MPEHLRTLVVILVLSTAIFAVARRPADAISLPGDFTRRRNVWFALTLVAFLSHSFWIYAFLAIPLLIHANHKESNPPALYLFLLFVLPVAYARVPGLGLINYLFELSHARLLSLLVLLPAFFSLPRSRLAFGRTGPDKVFAAYLLLVIALQTREATLTGAFREFFYLFIDVFLPYFVISRYLKTMQDFRDASFSLVLAIMVLAAVAVFEASRHWLLYESVLRVLELEGMASYLGRDGILRAIATAGQPIALGYLMVTGIGFYLFVQRSIQQKLLRQVGMALLTLGLITPLSRGPWVGAVVLIIVFIATGRHVARRMVGLVLAGVMGLLLISALPGGEKLINMLPVIGKTEKANITYREKLISNSLTVIERNPWFGSVDYLKTPDMEEMRQGQGIIDIVNTYIGITLERGIVGLLLFVAFFVLTLWGIYKAMRLIPDKDSEERLLGRVLVSTLLAIMLIIFTVSSITVIPVMYWSVAAIGVAYTQMIRKHLIT